ncbi:hypothetical protein [Bacillus suaedae]|uniref:Group-specific protein n=1 Tax=Halalkalibacter suaedae TaxID=2822140 RepID=A0A940WU20_9BACI|nr:hypothetical protein [Bacillus suaedae]MBP3952475.1 hypothetical protein [Bacillus suaedae]
MFHPTHFENLKVAFENTLYDLDNLDEEITVINRLDQLDMAAMSREFSLQFVHNKKSEVIAELWLGASLKDLAGELLELEDEKPGCTLLVRFYIEIPEVSICEDIAETLNDIWNPEIPITQTLSFHYQQEEKINFTNKIEIGFDHKLTEDHMEDLPELVEVMIRSINALEAEKGY